MTRADVRNPKWERWGAQAKLTGMKHQLQAAESSILSPFESMWSGLTPPAKNAKAGKSENVAATESIEFGAVI